jgi:glutathione S-transferase
VQSSDSSREPMSGKVYKEQLRLAHLGLDYQYVPTSWADGGTGDPEFLRLNPNVKVPVLIDGGFVLPEGNAILYYLANCTAPWPKQKAAQAQVLQWMFFEQYSHEPYIAANRYLMHVSDGSPNPEQ